MYAPTSAYIHIPFCRRRCFYCDFAISVVGDRKRGDTSATMAQYIETLISEIQATPVMGDRPAPLQTVFFGGGTPSLLAVAQVAAILKALDHRFGISPTAEISMEMDPATFDLSHVQGYQAAGVNRISLGVQAFQDELLSAAGRFHRQADIVQAVDLLKQANVENFSLDLISGLPHQTLAQWDDALTQALALQPTHLSIYDLVVEPQTAFARYFSPGEAPLPTDAVTAQMYNLAQQKLVNQGYGHYEICNYAQPGYEAQHNLTYWRCEQNYGFGMGATSYVAHQRIDRPRTQRTYLDWVTQFIRQGGTTSDPVLPQTEQVMELLMMGLRLDSGISLETVYAVYGEPGLAVLTRALAPHIKNKWVIVEAHSSCDQPSFPRSLQRSFQRSDCERRNDLTQALGASDRIRLSDPQGFLMSNVVITDTFNALDTVKLESSIRSQAVTNPD